VIEVTLKGANSLIKELRDLPEGIEEKVILGLSQVAYDSAQKGAGKHFKTGALFQSLYNRKVLGGGRAVGHDPARAPHALFVVFGTRPHVIKPKKRKALRWVGPNGFIFAKSVNHPGYRGDNYMLRARDDALGQFKAITDNALKRSL
jgi:hypothetical protein